MYKLCYDWTISDENATTRKCGRNPKGTSSSRAIQCQSRLAKKLAFSEMNGVCLHGQKNRFQDYFKVPKYSSSVNTILAPRFTNSDFSDSILGRFRTKFRV
jgi:hypothetical protein